MIVLNIVFQEDSRHAGFCQVEVDGINVGGSASAEEVRTMEKFKEPVRLLIEEHLKESAARGFPAKMIEEELKPPTDP